jgi:histone H3/H4
MPKVSQVDRGTKVSRTRDGMNVYESATKERKKRRARAGVRAQQEVRKWQKSLNSSTPMHPIAFANFARIMRHHGHEAISKFGKEFDTSTIQFSKNAIELGRTVAEGFIIDLFIRADDLRDHRSRKTLHRNDWQKALRHTQRPFVRSSQDA